MKKVMLCSLLTLVTLIGFSGCSDCKKCHAEVMGVKSPEQELCGDQLEEAKKTPGMVCE